MNTILLASLLVVVATLLVGYLCRHTAVQIVKRPVMVLFHYFYYRESTRNAHWMGVPLLKLPLDLWRYQDVIWETKPDLIVETGTNRGGSALYMAQLCDIIGRGRVVTVDITHPPEGLPSHARITYILGSSTDVQIVAEITAHVRPGEKVMVILDSDHARDHVARELELYAPLVSRGCYLVVEDTNVHGHPVYRSHGPGPMEAVDIYRPETKGFQLNSNLEKRYQITYYPRGWWQRIQT